MTPPAPTVDADLGHASTESWAENHCVITTVFDNVGLRRSFDMTIRPEHEEKNVPRVITFALVVVFESEPVSFVVDFELRVGAKSKQYTASCDARKGISKSRDAIPAPSRRSMEQRNS